MLTVVLVSLLSINNYAQKTVTTSEHGRVYVSEKGTRVQPKKPVTPDEVWGKLFTDVQLKMVLGDNKTFADAVPKFSPKVILKKYQNAQKTQDSSFHLKDFVFQNFKVPVAANVKLPEKTTSLKKHLEELWPTLTRKADIIEKYSSLLPLPEAYVVPGGRLLYLFLYL
ncbi:MAG: trehalase family glycosidase [Segetibacter sp.]